MPTEVRVRGPDGRFTAGVSGNPQGRPPVSSVIKRLAQDQAPAALAELCRLAFEAQDERVRLGAANAILDRAIGKADRPSQALSSLSLAQVLQSLSDRSVAHSDVMASLRAGMDAKLIDHDHPNQITQE